MVWDKMNMESECERKNGFSFRDVLLGVSDKFWPEGHNIVHCMLMIWFLGARGYAGEHIGRRCEQVFVSPRSKAQCKHGS